MANCQEHCRKPEGGGAAGPPVFGCIRSLTNVPASAFSRPAAGARSTPSISETVRAVQTWRRTSSSRSALCLRGYPPPHPPISPCSSDHWPECRAAGPYVLTPRINMSAWVGSGAGSTREQRGAASQRGALRGQGTRAMLLVPPTTGENCFLPSPSNTRPLPAESNSATSSTPRHLTAHPTRQ